VPNVQLITLDLDNTLWDVDRVIIAAEKEMRAWLEQNVAKSLAIYESDVLPEIRQDVMATYANQVHDLSFMRTQVLVEVMRRAGLGQQAAIDAAQQAFEVFYAGRNRVILFPGALEMLADLSRRFQLYALTNGNADIHRAGIGHFFAGGFSSAEVGQKKPHADMFNAPLHKLGLQADQGIHIGDHLTDDIEGASAVGMHSIWVNLNGIQAKQNILPSQEVTHLNEIMHAVAKITDV